ncbi:hypothetical protein B566_EDAN017671 [Ephemera danica]|nr:hypothetical protein B566_EDAN017671 [Ephemera danica]
MLFHLAISEYFIKVLHYISPDGIEASVLLMRSGCLAQVEVMPRGETGVSRKDETCELCEQLVKHLRDVLVTNTTEEEFKDVLKGICRQTKTFKKQCLSLVDEYYPMAYSFLLNELDPRAGPLWLELPARRGFPAKPISLPEVVHVYNSKPEQLLGDDEARSYGDDGLVAPGTGTDPEAELVHIPLVKASSSVHVIGIQQLPVERYMPQTLIGGNRELCELCQYFLHYVQEEITAPATEAEIKEVVDEACDHLPKVISQQCRSFVATYGDAFVALLAQEIDPSQICPQLGLCPTGQLFKTEKSGEPMCPLCLYAVEQIDKLIKEDKTEASIRAALDKVCTVLPDSMKQECVTMVEKYTEELVDMLIADLTPQEICVYLKVCKPQSLPTPPPQQQKDTEIMTNEIPQSWPVVAQDDELVQRVHTVPKVKDSDPKCIICEFVMSQLDDMLKNNATEEEIKDAVHTVCNYLPTSVAKQCNDFVYEYADMVIQLLVQELEPKAVCQELSLCQPNAKPPAAPARASEAVCKLCIVVVEAMDKLLEDGNVEQDIDNLLEKVCTVIPSAEKQKCEEMIEQYGPAIAMLVAQLADSRDVCSELNLCGKTGVRHRLFGGSKCTWGPSYWCQSEFHAMACKATKHCQQKVWKAVKPAKRGN